MRSKLSAISLTVMRMWVFIQVEDKLVQCRCVRKRSDVRTVLNRATLASCCNQALAQVCAVSSPSQPNHCVEHPPKVLPDSGDPVRQDAVQGQALAITSIHASFVNAGIRLQEWPGIVQMGTRH
jgi:hypothetical protein